MVLREEQIREQRDDGVLEGGVEVADVEDVGLADDMILMDFCEYNS